MNVQPKKTRRAMHPSVALKSLVVARGESSLKHNDMKNVSKTLNMLVNQNHVPIRVGQHQTGRAGRVFVRFAQ